MRNPKSTNRFVICVNNEEYPASLELFKVYRTIPDKELQADGDMCVIDESGEDYIFPAEYFIPIQLSRPIVRVLNKSFAEIPATI